MGDAEDKAGPELCPEDVIAVAEAIRKDYHRDLADATILYIFTPKLAGRHGSVALGKAKRCSPVDRLLMQADYIICLNKDAWGKLTEIQQRALLDHELCHCTCSLDGDKWVKRPHDVEEFAEVIERHGLWKPDIERFAQAVVQTELFADRLPAREGRRGTQGADGSQVAPQDAQGPKNARGRKGGATATKRGSSQDDLDLTLSSGGKEVHCKASDLERIAAGAGED